MPALRGPGSSRGGPGRSLSTSPDPPAESTSQRARTRKRQLRRESLLATPTTLAGRAHAAVNRQRKRIFPQEGKVRKEPRCAPWASGAGSPQPPPRAPPCPEAAGFARAWSRSARTPPRSLRPGGRADGRAGTGRQAVGGVAGNVMSAGRCAGRCRERRPSTCEAQDLRSLGGIPLRGFRGGGGFAVPLQRSS